jgi:carbamoyltransferase
MLICGLKLTHDGGAAIIEDGALRVQIDSEKVANNPRFSSGDFDHLLDALAAEGIALKQIDAMVIDGWHPVGNGRSSEVSTNIAGAWRTLTLARYQESSLSSGLLEGLLVEDVPISYTSYYHVTGHIFSAYCTSPFAKRREGAFVLVWDGGMRPRLYFWPPEHQAPVSLGAILPMAGSLYADFATHFEPFDRESTPNPWAPYKELGRVAKLSCAGKVMAYTALGGVDDELARAFERCIAEPAGQRADAEHYFPEWLRIAHQYPGSTADILATFQAFLGRMLIRALRERVSTSGYQSDNLCFAGGCALNVQWNRWIRERSGLADVWVPPFPNDSGSALGMACAEMLARGHSPDLEWSVYAGPRLGAPPPNGRPCSIRDLAQLLHQTGEPIVVLHGRAELGPRALGNRSILASCIDPHMKQRLNEIKLREWYRPIAPICLEERAPEIFDPGTRDPYMLFAHNVRDSWKERIPAVVHLDGSARLQTVSARENRVMAELLEAYTELSGVPVLCNTSANLKGSGFFPDANSALRWGKVRFVWADGTLYDSSTAAH